MDHFYQNIKGWSTYKDQGELLNGIVNNLDDIKILELGVYYGRCTAMWAVQLINSNISFEYWAVEVHISF